MNAGLRTLKDELTADTLAAKRIETAIVTFGGSVQTSCDFTTAENFQPPILSAGGNTPMGAAILQGVQMLRQMKDQYKANGIHYYRPWIFLITDGEPTDVWQDAALQVKQGESAKAFSFFAVGVEEANFDTLRQIAVREPLKLKGLQFGPLFVWLSSSLTGVSRSTPGEAVPLQSPSGWASV